MNQGDPTTDTQVRGFCTFVCLVEPRPTKPGTYTIPLKLGARTRLKFRLIKYGGVSDFLAGTI